MTTMDAVRMVRDVHRRLRRATDAAQRAADGDEARRSLAVAEVSVGELRWLLERLPDGERQRVWLWTSVSRGC